MTEAEFMTAIIDAPEDDGPRLMFADWLDDCGDAERAEFIRVQIARFARPKQGKRALTLRADALLGTHRREWFPGPWHVTTSRIKWDREFASAIAERGFLAEARCSLAAWLGGPCGCRGTPTLVGHQATPVPGNAGEWNVRTEFISPPGPRASCPTCSGTGRTPGIAGAVMAAQPLTRVAATDKEPARLTTIGDVPDGYLWLHSPDFWHREHRGHDLPTEVYQLLPVTKHDDPEVLRQSLSEAMIALGKHKAQCAKGVP